MTATRVEFTSRVDRKGYKIIPAKRPSAGASWLDVPVRDAIARIVGCGGDHRALRLNERPMLYKEFANLKTPDELLEFITEYGPLTSKNEIWKLLDVAAQMKDIMHKKTTPPIWPVADLRASIVTDKGAIAIKVRPARLLDALWLQLGQALSGGAQFRKCERPGCGEWFPVGGKSGRRLVARFCTDKCRIEHNSLERTRKKRS